MKRATENTAVDDNGAPLKKHDDDPAYHPGARIARLRNEIGVEELAITRHKFRVAKLEREMLEAVRERELAVGKRKNL
jgi:hypothetical protein